MTDKPKIIIDVKGSAVKVYTPEGLDAEIVVRYWDEGSECDYCGEYTRYRDAVITPGKDHGLRFICPKCAGGIF